MAHAHHQAKDDKAKAPRRHSRFWHSVLCSGAATPLPWLPSLPTPPTRVQRQPRVLAHQPTSRPKIPLVDSCLCESAGDCAAEHASRPRQVVTIGHVFLDVPHFAIFLSHVSTPPFFSHASHGILPLNSTSRLFAPLHVGCVGARIRTRALRRARRGRVGVLTPR